MKCSKFSIMTAFLFFLSVAFPFLSYAAYTGSANPISPGFQLVPCDGVYVPCDFNALMELVNRIISFIFYLSIPLAAISFSYAGYLYLSAAGDTVKIESAHEIFKKVLIGFIFILSGWLIVYSITSVLLGNDFKNSKSNLLRNNGVQSGSGSVIGINGGINTNKQIYNNGTYNDGTNYIEGTKNPLTKPNLDISGIGGKSSIDNNSGYNNGIDYIKGSKNPLQKPQIQF